MKKKIFFTLLLSVIIFILLGIYEIAAMIILFAGLAAVLIWAKQM